MTVCTQRGSSARSRCHRRSGRLFWTLVEPSPQSEAGLRGAHQAVGGRRPVFEQIEDAQRIALGEHQPFRFSDIGFRVRQGVGHGLLSMRNHIMPIHLVRRSAFARQPSSPRPLHYRLTKTSSDPHPPPPSPPPPLSARTRASRADSPIDRSSAPPSPTAETASDRVSPRSGPRRRLAPPPPPPAALHRQDAARSLQPMDDRAPR